ncbi:MAG: hypothetical protein K1W19_01925 [Lachnospiraceae bacterium]
MQKKGVDDMADIFRIISITAFVIAGISFVCTLFFCFRYKIWEVIGEVSGRNKRIYIKKRQKEIEAGKNISNHKVITEIEAKNITAATSEDNTKEVKTQGGYEKTAYTRRENENIEETTYTRRNDMEENAYTRRNDIEETAYVKENDMEETITNIYTGEETVLKEENVDFKIIEDIEIIHTEKEI